MSDHLLEVRDLSDPLSQQAAGRSMRCENVSWHLDRGETLVILGESGSGKSVSASAVMGLIDIPPAEILPAASVFDGQDLLRYRRMSAGARSTAARIAMIFQDPLAALNPVYPVGRQIAESMTAHGVPAERGARAERSRFLRASASPIRSAVSTTTRTSSPAASASAS